jgi:hypothetical protein
MLKLRGLLVLLFLTFGLIAQGALAETARQEQARIFVDMASLRAHVVDMLEEDWRVTGVSVDPEHPNVIRLAQRRVHYPMSQDIDLQDLFDKLSGASPAETEMLIATFLEGDVFRPFSQGLVRDAYPEIWPRNIIDGWLERYPNPNDPALPAFVPLSPDAVIAVVNGIGTAGIVLRNYDFAGMPAEEILATALANLEKETESVAPIRGKDWIDRVPQVIEEGNNVRIIRGSIVLSQRFWRDMEKEYPAGAYLAFPNELHPYGTAGAVLIDKRTQNAKNTIRAMIDGNRKAALSRQIGPIDCDNEETFLRLAEQKPQSTARERSSVAYFAARLKKCNESRMLQLTGKLPPPDYTPVSSFIYERRNGRLEVVKEE